MNIENLEKIKEDIWIAFWETFFAKLTPYQRNSWGQRKPIMESLFKQAWSSGAQTVLDLLNDAVKNRPIVTLETTINPLPTNNTGKSFRVKR